MFHGSHLLISVHQLPGRIRVRSSELKRNDFLANEIKSAIMDVFGIESVRINTITGSILVFYNPRLIHSGPIFTELKKLDLMANVIGFPHAFPEIHINKIFVNRDWTPIFLECLKIVGRVILLMIVEQTSAIILDKLIYKFI